MIQIKYLTIFKSISRTLYGTFLIIEKKKINNRHTRQITPSIKILCDLKKIIYLTNNIITKY